MPANNEFQPLKVSAEELLVVLRHAGAAKAAGLDGLRYEHLWMATGSSAAATAVEDEARVSGAAPLLLDHIARIFNVLLSTPEVVPEGIQRLFGAASLSGIDDKVRPIACGLILRRLLCSTLAQRLKPLGSRLRELSQFGFGTPSGTEHAAVDARLWHELGPGGSLLLLDCENAFNSIDRAKIIEGIERFEAALLPLFDFLYCGAKPRSCVWSCAAAMARRKTAPR